MNKIDNDLPLDDEVIEIMEELLSAYLERLPVGKWFTLQNLYRGLNIEFSCQRTGTLDKIIIQTLEAWNWHFSDFGRGIEKYVRRNYPSEPKTIKLCDGQIISITYSWPPHFVPRKKDENEPPADVTRALLLDSLRFHRERTGTGV